MSEWVGGRRAVEWYRITTPGAPDHGYDPVPGDAYAVGRFADGLKGMADELRRQADRLKQLRQSLGTDWTGSTATAYYDKLTEVIGQLVAESGRYAQMAEAIARFQTEHEIAQRRTRELVAEVIHIVPVVDKTQLSRIQKSCVSIQHTVSDSARQATAVILGLTRDPVPARSSYDGTPPPSPTPSPTPTGQVTPRDREVSPSPTAPEVSRPSRSAR